MGSPPALTLHLRQPYVFLPLSSAPVDPGGHRLQRKGKPELRANMELEFHWPKASQGENLFSTTSKRLPQKSRANQLKLQASFASWLSMPNTSTDLNSSKGSTRNTQKHSSVAAQCKPSQANTTLTAAPLPPAPRGETLPWYPGYKAGAAPGTLTQGQMLYLQARAEIRLQILVTVYRFAFLTFTLISFS